MQVEALNNSPWLDAPGVSHAFPVLKKDLDADVVVIGGWIAGVMTSFFLLHNTERSVTLLEWNKVAHGATWHNAGQIDVFFETPIDEMIEKYGTELTRNAYQAMFDGRENIEDVIDIIDWQGYYTKYIGYNVYSTKEQVIKILEQFALFASLWLEFREIFLNQDMLSPEDIASDLLPYVNWISSKKGAELIWSRHLERLGFEATQYATLNSAALCQWIIHYMIDKYPDRFSIYEHTRVDNIETVEHGAILSIGNYTINCKDVVLATNAFNHHTINQKKDTEATTQVRWYMAGYMMSDVHAPKTICYYKPDSQSYTDAYFYQTTRHYLNQQHEDKVLLTLGWPEIDTSEAVERYPEEHKKSLDQYVDTYYQKPVHARYYWRWDMAYTENWMRKIGPSSEYLHIRYNLGCNGVWILGSAHGGRKIAEYFNGNVKEKSVFDIQ